MLLVAATPLGGTVILSPPPRQSLTKHLLYAGFAALIVLTGSSRPGGSYSRLSRRLLRHLGHISYSIFCIHLVVLHLA